MKKNTKVIVIVVVVVGLIFVLYAMNKGKGVEYSANATSSQPTRLQQTEVLISKLAEDRKRDQSFIDETKRQEKALNESRERQARLDALLIVQTQIQTEAAEIEKQQEAAKNN